MDLKLRSVHAEGGASKEYAIIDVLDDANLQNYALADTTFLSPSKISNKFKHVYFFPIWSVQAGDIVVLHTGRGKARTQPNGNAAIHHLYWGSDAAVWNDQGDGAVLMQFADWETMIVK